MAEKKFTLIIIVFILMALLGGCSSSDDNNIVPGYWSPGKFRPKGVAYEKAYNFQDLSASGSTTPEPRTCSSVNNDGRCRVIYASWPTGTSYTENVILNGFALDDSHTLGGTVKALTFIAKVINTGGTWTIYMVINGVEYKGTASGSDVTVTDETSAIFKEPYCGPDSTPPCAETFEASKDQLKLKRIVFNTPVPLNPTIYLTPTATPPISIQSGDFITAQMYGI